MVYTVRNKTFKIDFVSNYVHEKYQQLVELTYDLVNNEKVNEIVELAKTDTEKAGELLKKVEIERKERAKEILEIRREIVKEIVESNGIEYDLIWWSKKTAPDDINEFMLSCVRQDLTSAKESKKK